MLIHNNFRSWCLQTNTDVDIIIPDMPQGVDAKQFFLCEKKYPVLWLLHGTWGGYSDFVRRTNIDLYAKECNIMVVMPNAMNSEYSNWPKYNLGYNMYDFLTEELMPMIQGTFPASPKKEDNFICGLSMGSIGAYKYAINHPGLFAGCSCMSGTPSNVEKLYKQGKCTERTLFNIENAGGIDKYLNSYENLWGKTKEAVGKQSEYPLFYFSVGKDDFLYSSYKEFEKYAKEIGFEAKWEELDGYAHEWRFWELEIQKSLELFGLNQKRNITTAQSFNKIDPSKL